MVCKKEEYSELKQEWEKLLKLNVNCRFVEKKEIQEYHGKDSSFEAGILFPDDAIINSSKYCETLLDFI